MRLRKFNESIESLDLEYIKDCFIHFIDNDIFTIKFDLNSDGNMLIITIEKLGKIYDEDGKSNKSFTAEYKENIIYDVKTDIMKIGGKYPDLYYYLDNLDYGDEMYFIIGIHTKPSSLSKKISTINI